MFKNKIWQSINLNLEVSGRLSGAVSQAIKAKVQYFHLSVMKTEYLKQQIILENAKVFHILAQF